MVPEVKFTPFGIPYLVEFSNIAFRKRSKSNSSSTVSTADASSRTNPSRLAVPGTSVRAAASTPFLPTRSTVQQNAPTLPLNPDISESEGEGLLIRFASHRHHPYRPLSETRIAALKVRIANAVIAAGMDTPSTDRGKSSPERCISHGRVLTSDLRRPRGVAPAGALFRGTYGQVTSALHAAGLTTTPCHQAGFSNAQRLGAMFVARPTDDGTLELAKLTLWA
ncbi:hypothetical protein BXZ70DRAFT_217271 [Cristinia sonorae]|uniref:Uncharacterized protein n=1 Tax=Cristinia sonorae TaxID=1940300 RepID=A0A8K0UM47_9AGAR|nr:hypothetical protein BXZ70DRAFT_217271 [Cristinia sonorae]